MFNTYHRKCWIYLHEMIKIQTFFFFRLLSLLQFNRHSSVFIIYYSDSLTFIVILACDRLILFVKFIAIISPRKLTDSSVAAAEAKGRAEGLTAALAQVSSSSIVILNDTLYFFEQAEAAQKRLREELISSQVARARSNALPLTPNNLQFYIRTCNFIFDFTRDLKANLMIAY